MWRLIPNGLVGFWIGCVLVEKHQFLSFYGYIDCQKKYGYIAWKRVVSCMID